MYGLINLAGRQLLPNILASLAFSRTGDLRQNVVLHTDNRLESHLPAMRLHDALDDDPNKDSVNYIRIPVDETIQSVHDAAIELFAEFPDLRWILHATGGNKMMSAAFVDLARHPQVAAVVYRDIVTGWQQVAAPVDGSLIQSPITPKSIHVGCLVDPEVRLDILPLRSLVQAQVQDYGDRAPLKVAARGPLKNADPEAWIRDVHQHSSRSFLAYVARENHLPADGPAFEAWLCGVIAAAGARQALWTCKVYSRTDGDVLECDVVALHSNRIAVYDAKLDRPDAKGKSHQIRAAAKTAQDLGGLSATAVLVRPNWPRASGTMRFAEAMNVHLVAGNGNSDFVHQLLMPLGLHGALLTNSVLRGIQESLNAIYKIHWRHPFQHLNRLKLGLHSESVSQASTGWPRAPVR